MRSEDDFCINCLCYCHNPEFKNNGGECRMSPPSPKYGFPYVNGGTWCWQHVKEPRAYKCDEVQK